MNDDHTIYMTIPENRPIYKQQQNKRYGWIINLALFLITIGTTTLAGAAFKETKTFDWDWYWSGLHFSIPLLIILAVHEMGHFIASKRHKLLSTLPYFIPAPTLIGTFGAFIKIKEAIRDRKSLFDIGASGPLAGFIAAIPVLIYGVMNSTIVKLEETTTGINLGESFILKFAVFIIKGHIPDGYQLFLSQAGFAAWIGLFITSMNLLPIGQLDGGHIFYALFGDKMQKIFKILVFVLLAMGYFWVGWIMWGLLLFFVLGTKHPPIINFEPLDINRKIIGAICIFVFIITFMPVPSEGF